MDIRAVSIDDIHSRLGFAERLKFPNASRTKALTEWKMEVDDSPIFRYLYRNFKPRRHLEFGTWMGTGVTYCLEECGATVWTVNIPFGEDMKDGKKAYGVTPEELEDVRRWAKKIGMPPNLKDYRTDIVGFIGRAYLEKNLGGRVCQIYCNSKDWDISNYPEGFFDSVLIDGGHLPEDVVNDTKKSFRLLRPGGLLMWHDFCPAKEVVTNCQSAKNVVGAIESNWDWIVKEMKDIFWINPSWILAGIKK